MAHMDFTDNHGVLPVESRKMPPTSMSLGSPDSSGTGTVRRVPPPTPGARLDNGRFQRYFRLSRTQFEDLLSCVGRRIGQPPTTGAISPLLNACPSVFVLSREESEAAEASAFDQDDGEPVPGHTTDLFPAVSSTASVPPKGPSSNST
ncbi:hypothetical protein CRENBAI_011488 [Crenichthys baileyi]|uniref:Uncharacterized protein n=1 Tax=Crenichthys baileyi TaxID=28760 RepID=A0AAV9QYI3_9TELE